MKLILLTLCLTPLASALFTTLYWCDTNGYFTDPMVFTQQGQDSLVFKDVVLIGMDSPSEKDQLQECESRVASMGPGPNLVFFSLAAIRNKSGESVGYMGNATNQNNYNYMLIKPFEEEIMGAKDFEAGVMNAGSNGYIRMTITYWSKTEIVLRTCHNAFFGSSHAAYVFSSQKDNLLDLSSECMVETIRSLPDMDIFDIQMTPLENIKNCME